MPYRRLLIGITALIAVGAACAAVVTIGPGRASEPETRPPAEEPPTRKVTHEVFAAMPEANDPATVALALTECRSQVLAAEEVIEAAGAGIRHWREHLRAQTDFDKGRLTYVGMESAFARTAKKGVDDRETWESAAASYESDPDSCGPIIGASGPQRSVMVDCAIRLNALEQAIPDGSAAMKDWTGHLARAHRDQDDENAEAAEHWSKPPKSVQPKIDEWRTEMAEIDEKPSCRA